MNGHNHTRITVYRVLALSVAALLLLGCAGFADRVRTYAESIEELLQQQEQAGKDAEELQKQKEQAEQEAEAL